MKKPKQTVADVKRLMDEWDFERNEAEGIFPDKLGSQSNEKAHWICRYGHRWKAKINNRYNGRGCPECNKWMKTSFPEQALYFYVKQLFPDAINGYKDLSIDLTELDVYIPSKKIGIEYDGLAWHKDNQIAKEQKKFEICKSNGIRLYRIKENINHYKDGEKLANNIFIMRHPYADNKNGYADLDKCIKELVNAIFPDANDILGLSNKTIEEQLNELVYGPKVALDINVRRDKNLILESYKVSLEAKSLGNIYPDVANLWHPTKNGNLTPSMFSPNSNVKVWWLGECGHEWENPITVLTRGDRCPYCSGKRVLKGFNDLATKYPNIAKQWHSTKNGKYTPDMFTGGSGHMAIWHCDVCGQDWPVHINVRTSHNRGCPYCTHQKPIVGINDLPTKRPDLMKEWHPTKNKGIDPTTLMANSNKEVWWKCSKCGYEYKAYINSRNKGTGCKNCAGQVLHKGVNDLETLYPDVAKEWDYESNGDVKPCDVFPFSNTKYNWRCSKGHVWPASPNARVSGRGCPYCSGNKVLVGFNDLETTHPDIAKELHPTLNGDIDGTKISRGYTKKLWFLCPKCGRAYDAYIGNKIKGFGKCPCQRKIKGKDTLILQVETGRTFATFMEAAASVSQTDIRPINACCKGHSKMAYGFHWKYIDK